MNNTSMPYIPGNESETPSQRSIVFADALDNQVYEIKEHLRFNDNASCFWESASLNQHPDGSELTLRTLMFKYAAESDTMLNVGVSGNGGEFWFDKVLNLTGTAGRIRRIRTHFNITGEDIRIRFTFTEPEVVKIFSFFPSLIRRGRVNL